MGIRGVRNYPSHHLILQPRLLCLTDTVHNYGAGVPLTNRDGAKGISRRIGAIGHMRGGIMMWDGRCINQDVKVEFLKLSVY